MRSLVPLALLCSTLASCAGGATPADQLVGALESDHIVQEGEVRPFRISDCVSLPSCFGNNASSPYGLFWLPPSPGTTTEDIGLTSESLPPDDDGWTAGWTMRADEAVVYVGRTPPSAAYFSFTPYLFARSDGEGGRATIFADLADSINLTHVGDAPFGQEIAIILTADRALEAEARRALERGGLDTSRVYTLALDSELLRLGVDAGADQILLLHRVALFEDEAEGEAYLDAIPGRIFRVTPREPRALVPLDPPIRTPRAFGESESPLRDALDALEAAVEATHSEAEITPVRIVGSSVIALVLDAAQCIANLRNCLGPVSDTVYSAGPIEDQMGISLGDPVSLGDAPGERLVAIGVNHVATGRATYSNVVAMHQARLAGVAAFDSRSMPGTAARYLPDHPDADRLFAVSFMRDCGGEPACVEVPTGFPGVDPDENIGFAFRAYLQPGESVSAAPSDLLPERVLHIVPQ